MKINRMAEEYLVPNWALKNEKADEIKKATEEIQKGLQHLDCTASNDVTDIQLVSECERIDECIQKNEIYHYNSTWKSEDLQHLREYAKVSGLQGGHMIGLDPLAVKESLNETGFEVTEDAPVQRTASSTQMTKIASNDNDENEVTPADFKLDPFRLQELLDKKEVQADNWETVAKQSDLADKPAMESSVRPIRGGEDTSINSEPALAANQNSILNPDAIGKLAESEIQDNGARLAAEQAAKEAAKVANHAQWEQDKIDAMEHSDIVSKGTVFPTEALNAQTGIRDSVMAAHSDYDPNNLPEKTSGEMIAERNKAHKESIQRETQTDDWEVPSGQSTFNISDDFANSLRDQLNN